MVMVPISRLKQVATQKWDTEIQTKTMWREWREYFKKYPSPPASPYLLSHVSYIYYDSCSTCGHFLVIKTILFINFPIYSGPDILITWDNIETATSALFFLYLYLPSIRSAVGMFAAARLVEICQKTVFSVQCGSNIPKDSEALTLPRPGTDGHGWRSHGWKHSYICLLEVRTNCFYLLYHLTILSGFTSQEFFCNILKVFFLDLNLTGLTIAGWKGWWKGCISISFSGIIQILNMAGIWYLICPYFLFAPVPFLLFLYLIHFMFI